MLQFLEQVQLVDILETVAFEFKAFSYNMEKNEKETDIDKEREREMILLHYVCQLVSALENNNVHVIYIQFFFFYYYFPLRYKIILHTILYYDDGVCPLFIYYIIKIHVLHLTQTYYTVVDSLPRNSLFNFFLLILAPLFQRKKLVLFVFVKKYFI